ncbi:MAG: hypothetical protein AAF703_10920 [Cyanobacteria bacterium P01_D01_bin.105]
MQHGLIKPMGIQSFLQTIVQNAATWGEGSPSVERGDILERVPPRVFNQLAEKGRQLPAPEVCKATVQASLTEAIARWQANPDVENNSLVILSSPAEDLATIFKAVLHGENTAFEQCNIRFLMQGYQRPADPLEIKRHIRREIEKLPDDEPDTQPTLVVIPHLEQCFLRCIQGWEGVEYLQNFTTRDSSRFWIVGCNHWAWTFLDRVCQISAYLEQPVQLPELSGEALKSWLLPFFSDVVTVLNLKAADDEHAFTLEPGADGYWQSLSNLSSGIGTTATRLWLKSLRLCTGDRESDNGDAGNGTSDNQDFDDAQSLSLVPIKPALPSAITFNAIDRYLLQSLLIHGETTRDHLALSLGEAERKIRDRLQVLKREGIIIQKGRRLSVHPAHYPRLYNELKNNNFLIGAR